MFAIPVVVPPETRCRTYPLPAHGSRGVIGGVKRIVYDFDTLTLGAIERGPRARHRERPASRMSPLLLQRPFARRANHITRCWKWFSATHPGGDTTLDVRLAIDAFGATGDVAIVNAPADADLAACVRDAFATPLHVYGPRSRDQQTHATLQFVRADQPAWPTPPVRPTHVIADALPARGSVCVRVGGEPIAARLGPLRISDFDPARAPRRGSGPALRVGCVSVAAMPRKKHLLAAIRSNWGAYEACHADARARLPELAGTVEAKLIFDLYGAEPTLASVRGAGDAELHACLDRAFEEIWLDPPSEGSLLEVNLTLALSAERSPAPRDRAAWHTKLASAPSSLEACRARHALLADRLAAAPWIDDARVRAAVAELARYIATRSHADASACLAEVEATLRDYAELDDRVLSIDASRVEPHVDRLDALRPLAPIAPWGANLLLAIARAYRNDPARFAEGSALLDELRLDPRVGDRIRIDDAPRPLENSCAL